MRIQIEPTVRNRRFFYVFIPHVDAVSSHVESRHTVAMKWYEDLSIPFTLTSNSTAFHVYNRLAGYLCSQISVCVCFVFIQSEEST